MQKQTLIRKQKMNKNQDKQNQSQDDPEYNVGDRVIFNSFFDEGCVELLVCKITAKRTYAPDCYPVYDLEAVDEDRSFENVEPKDIFQDSYSLHVLLDDAVDYLIDRMVNTKSSENR